MFSIGCGLGLAHAWHAYHRLDVVEPPTSINFVGLDIDPIWVSVVVLLIAFIIEGYVLVVAGREDLQQMRGDGYTNPFAYLGKVDDPTLVAVVLEDAIAVSGVVFAAAGIGLSWVTGNPLWDIGFSVVIAVMLGFTAFFLAAINMRFLTDVRDLLAEEVIDELEKDLRKKATQVSHVTIEVEGIAAHAEFA